jgi:ATP adenylyltransferase
MSTKFEALKRFISSEMRMSHIYQPVMLIEMLRNDGTASTERIARALLGYDSSQVEYYERITKNMVGRVLTTGRGIAAKEKDVYSLVGYSDLSSDQLDILVELCEKKLTEFLARRGDQIWDHRKKSSGYIPGTLRYQVLKRAKFRCELCGISAEHRALEIDHIIPRNKQGSDEESNLQALCYSCNSTKRDQDDADLRGIRDSYYHRVEACLFCAIPSHRVIAENELAYAIEDAYPVTPGHVLVIPKRHVEDYFSLYQPELNAINRLLSEQRRRLLDMDQEIEGFNVGNNAGVVAGQTIMHCHIHLIPRRRADVDDPRGGVRGVIPAKQSY